MYNSLFLFSPYPVKKQGYTNVLVERELQLKNTYKFVLIWFVIQLKLYNVQKIWNGENNINVL